LGNGGLPIDCHGARQSSGERLTRLADLEPTVCPSRTVSSVPAGTTSGVTGGGSVFVEPAESGGLVAPEELVSPEPFAPVGLLLQPGRATDRQRLKNSASKRSRIASSSTGLTYTE
jgi:hypothetical protein